MKVVVTGATGFLGSVLCAALTGRGDEVTAVHSRNHNLRDARALDELREEYDQIYHLAGWTQAGDFCLHHSGEQWIINQQLNTTMIGWWAARQPQAKLISIGTSCAYDPRETLTEENYLTGCPIDGLYTYAMTKRMLHIGQMAVHRQYGHRCLTVVPSTLYGPGYYAGGRQRHFIFDLIRKILRAKIIGEKAVLWGDGLQRRELVYVNDFVHIILQLASRDDCQLVNVGAGEEHSIRKFASTICDFVGYDSELIDYDSSRYVGATSKCLDTRLLHRLFPGISMTPLDVGLERTIEWFRSDSKDMAS